MKRAKFFGILMIFILALLIAVQAGFVSKTYAAKPEDPPGQGKKPPPPPPPENDRLPWGVERIRANVAWDTDGDLNIDPDANGVNTITGNGIKVAVLDTGIDPDHPDLAANFVVGINTVGNEPSGAFDDAQGHGTMISGIIAAVDNGIGVIGVAPEADLYVARFRGVSGAVLPEQYPGFDRTVPSTYKFTDLYEAMDWCISQNVQIISMSFGIWTLDQNNEMQYPLHDPAFYSRIQQAYNNGIVLIAAAGNDNREIGKYEPPLPSENTPYPDKEYDFPASYPEVIGVSATYIKTTKGKPGTTQTIDIRASFSNYGGAIDIAAPGVSIESTTPDGEYGTGGGTSYASPHISGAAALVLEKLGYALPASGMPQEVYNILTSSAKDIGDPLYFGYGLVDAKAAVDAAGPVAAGAPSRHPIISPTGKVSVTWGKLKGE